jgi:hypothetical protein
MKKETKLKEDSNSGKITNIGKMENESKGCIKDKQ